MNDQPLTLNNSDVIDRLARLRAVLPLMATDLAVARRRTRVLAEENEQLRRRVRELESEAVDPQRARKPAARHRRIAHLAAP